MMRALRTGVAAGVLGLAALALSFGVPAALAGGVGAVLEPSVMMAGSQGSENSRQAPRTIPGGVSNVTVIPDEHDPRVVWLRFDSELLGLEAVNRILLPSSYDEEAAPFGTLYHLHGTRGLTALGDMIVDALGMSDAGQDQAATEEFLVVSLDAGSPGWCNSCWWVDGRDGQGVMAESHLHMELIPVMEAVFNVRRDRDGRAIYGASMGGIGALIQAFRHPDRFAYVASQSGPPSAFEHNDALQLAVQDGLYFSTYLVGQGYPDPVTQPVVYRNIDVVTLAPQMAGSGVEIVLYANDGCLPPYDEDPQPVGDPDCISTGQLNPDHAFQMANEWGIRTDNEIFADRLIDVGVPFRLETDHGRHGISTLYRNHILPDLNRVFASSSRAPELFSYKTIDREFSIWGYDFTVLDRPNEEFLHVLGAQVNGREFTLAGTGLAQVLTPRMAEPGTAVEVTLVREDAPTQVGTTTTDEEGRVVVELDLGETRSMDQRRGVSRQGLMAFPRTRVEIRVDDLGPGRGRQVDPSP